MVALSDEPDALDPTTGADPGRPLGLHVDLREALRHRRASSTIVPQLAAALPQISADGKTVTIKLRTGVKFADGTAMDAAAVKTSLDRAPDPADLGPQERPGQRRRASSVTDPSTVVLTPQRAVRAADRAARRPRRHDHVAGRAQGRGRQLRRRTRSASGRSSSPSRVAQDRIDVVKDPNYYDAANVHLDKVVVQDHRRLDHPVQQPALRRRPGARRGRADRRRRAAGRPQPAAAHLGLARLPGHHRQPRQRQRRRQAGRDAAGQPGQRDGHRSRGCGRRSS